MRRRTKECRPQFVRMNAAREEAPPPRHITCPDYRDCLAQAAFQNFCLDCSQCAADEQAATGLPGMPPAHPSNRRGTPFPAVSG